PAADLGAAAVRVLGESVVQPEVLVIIVIMGIGAYFLWRSRVSAGLKGGEDAAPKTVANLEPGDAVSFWDGQNCLVDTVLDCSEEVGGRATHWHWVLLNDRRLLEIAPDRRTAYGPAEIVFQGSGPFEQLTGSHGALKAFEQRVREGAAGSLPVHFSHGQANYQLKSTGTFAASIRGKEPVQDVLRDISPKAGENVYFEMESNAGAVSLGIWTTHIALYFGQVLKESDIVGIFPKGKEAKI
ncbi:MAG: hypothetical protein Q7R39_09050, partial [Dehalococcoidia bacterium]|nr:hypothetical protein [Dehalococcoidia bacterium]